MPVPGSTSSEWYVADGGEQTGPFAKSEIASMLAQGAVSTSAQLWREGMDSWVPIGSIIPPQVRPSSALGPNAPVGADPAFTHRKPTKKSSPRTLVIVTSVVGIAVVAWSARNWRPQSNIIPSLFAPVDPKFSITQIRFDAPYVTLGIGWRIVNESESPLIIHRVRINDEFDAQVADTNASIIWASQTKAFPVTLTIGDHAEFLQYTAADNDEFEQRSRDAIPGGNMAPRKPKPDPSHIRSMSYNKKAVFVDIDTDRGNFRYENGSIKSR